MHHLAMILAALLLQAVDQIPETNATRPYGGAYVTPAALPDLQACITDHFDNVGKVDVYRIADGIVIDFLLRPLGLPSFSKPRIRLTVSDEGRQRRVTATYSRPMTAKSVGRQFRIFAKQCGGEAIDPS